jgi:hypothetical protein
MEHAQKVVDYLIAEGVLRPDDLICESLPIMNGFFGTDFKPTDTWETCFTAWARLIG